MLKLDDNYAIDSDAFNVILRFENIGEINPKTGKPIISSSETYHPTLEQAVGSYVNQRLKSAIGTDVYDLDAFISEVRELKKDIFNKVDNLNKTRK